MTPQQTVIALRRRGWSDAAIGRAIGRDSSQVHAIGAGRTKGINLAAALGELLDRKSRPPRRGEPVAPALQTPERRPARYRQGARVTPRGDRLQTFRPPQSYQGTYARFLRGSRSVEFIADVTYVAQRGRELRGEVRFLGHGGVNPEYLLYSSPPSPNPWEATIFFLNNSHRVRGKGPSDSLIVAMHSITVTRRIV